MRSLPYGKKGCANLIIDSLGNMGQYIAFIPHLAEGLTCLQLHSQETSAATYPFEGGYLMLQTGTTRALEDGSFETHQKYLDVQVLLDGLETVAWADVSELEEAAPYDSEKDKALFNGRGSAVEIRPGMCYICAPQDAHKACRHTEAPANYRKAVLKLEIV